MNTQDAINLIAKWLVNSIPASAIDRLTDHVIQEKVESNEAYEIGEMLIDAINEINEQ
jgi:hypothetical protein